MCLFGYNGRIRANVIADSSVFPDENDVATFVEEFEREFLILGKSIGLKDQDCFTECVNNSKMEIMESNQKYLETMSPVTEMIHFS